MISTGRLPSRVVRVGVAGVLVLGAVGFQLGSGVPLSTTLLVTLAVVVQTFAGVLIWTKISGHRGLLELMGMGIALGIAMAAVTGVIFVSTGLSVFGCFLPAAAICLGELFSRYRHRADSATGASPSSISTREMLALMVGLGLGLISLILNVRHYPLEWSGTWSGYHLDMPFFEALSNSLAQVGARGSVFMPGAEMRYHWLSYAWSGQLTAVTGAEPFVVLTRIFQYSTVVASVCLVVSWTSSVTRRLWSPTLAVLLLLLGGYIGVVNGSVLNFDSPSQSMGVVWLLASSIASLTFVRSSATLGKSDFVAWLALLGFLGFVTTGGKISSAAPLIVALGLAAGVGVFRHAPWGRRAVQAFVAAACGALVAYIVMFAGANGGGGLALGALIDRTSSQQGINPVEGYLGVVLGTAILLLAVSLRWAGAVWLAVASPRRTSPDVIFAVGLMAVGLIAIVLFNGFNEIWFAAAASAPLAVFSAEGFEEALDHLKMPKKRSTATLVLMALVAAVAIFAIVWMLWATGPAGGGYWRGTWRWAGPLAALALGVAAGWGVSRFAGDNRRKLGIFAGFTLVLVLVAMPGRLLGVGSGQVGVPPSLSPDLFSFGIAPSVRGHDEKLFPDIPWEFLQAGQWVREHAKASDLLATNLTFGPLVPAVTGLATFASGIQYQAPYGRPAVAAELLRRDDEIWKFVNFPSLTTVVPLCASGVRWIWVDPTETSTRSWEPFANVAFSNDVATILEMDPHSCAGSSGA